MSEYRIGNFFYRINDHVWVVVERVQIYSSRSCRSIAHFFLFINAILLGYEYVYKLLIGTVKKFHLTISILKI